MRPLNIAVAEGRRECRESLRGLLIGLGHRVVALEGGPQLLELCRASRPDLVVLGGRLPDPGGIAAAGPLAGETPVPVILVADSPDAELAVGAETDYVMGYLVRPVRPADLEAAVTLALLRFGKFQAARAEAAWLRQALEERTLIERAKGALMKRLGLGEEEAYYRLRELSSHRGQKLVEVARGVLAADDVFRELDR